MGFRDWIKNKANKAKKTTKKGTSWAKKTTNKVVKKGKDTVKKVDKKVKSTANDVKNKAEDAVNQVDKFFKQIENKCKEAVNEIDKKRKEGVKAIEKGAKEAKEGLNQVPKLIEDGIQKAIKFTKGSKLPDFVKEFLPEKTTASIDISGIAIQGEWTVKEKIIEIVNKLDSGQISLDDMYEVLPDSISITIGINLAFVVTFDTGACLEFKGEEAVRAVIKYFKSKIG